MADLFLALIHHPVLDKNGQIVTTEAIVTGSNCYGYSGIHTDFEVAIDLIASGKVAPAKIVTHRFPFSESAQAFAIAADKSSGAVKVHLVNEGSE